MKKSICFILVLYSLVVGCSQDPGLGKHGSAVADSTAESHVQIDSVSMRDAMALYDKGINLIARKNYSGGKECILRSANLGYHKAMITAGIYYMYEEYGFEHNMQNELYFFNLAAEEGDPEGQYCMGFCYAIGEGVKKSSRKAMRYLSMAARQGEPNAQLMLGSFYCQGKHVIKNQKKAFRYFISSAEKGNPTAQYFVGRYFVEGIHGEQNRSVGIGWLKKAKEQGSLEATRYLERFGIE